MISPQMTYPQYEGLRQVLDTLGTLEGVLVYSGTSSLLPRLHAVLKTAKPKSQTDKLHEAWTEFISTQDYQWFVTFTFKEEIHPEAADKLFRVWINKLNRSLYGQRWRKHPPYGVKWVRALEWQKRGVLHYHALIANVGYQSRELWAAVWTELGVDSKAGFIKIDQYNEALGGAEAYLSKYVAKGGQVDISPNFQEQNQIPDHELRKQSDHGDLDRV